MKLRIVVLVLALILGVAAGAMLPAPAEAQSGGCEDDLCHIYQGTCFDAQNNKGWGCNMCSGCTFGCDIYPCV